MVNSKREAASGEAPSREDAVVFTLDARDSVLLEVMTSHLDLTPEQVRGTILGSLQEATAILARKGIAYEELRNALVPQRKRREIALFFLADQGGYGWGPGSASDSVLRLLPKQLNCAILTGDLLARDQYWAFQVLMQHHVGHKPVELAHTSQLYAVYLNNLSDAMVESITDSLVAVDSYVGFADCSYASDIKDWLSTTVSTAYLKFGGSLIGGHEDDVSNDGDYNLRSWPAERYGYVCRSLQAMYFDLFLAYKIERQVLPGETDTRFALSAISDAPKDLGELDVLVAEDKLGYLRDKKLGTLTAAGLQHATSTDLAKEIRSRIKLSYVYEMSYKQAWGVSQFNVMLEMARVDSGEPVRVKAVLSYEPELGQLRLVSLY